MHSFFATYFLSNILHFTFVKEGVVIGTLLLALILLIIMIFYLFIEKRSSRKLKSEVDATKVQLVEKTEIQNALFQGSIDPIIIFNTKNQVVDYNIAAEEFFGYNFFKLIGKEFPGNESFNNKFTEYLKVFNKGEGISGFNTYVKLYNGENVAVSISISPIFNSSHELTNLFFWYRDISKDQEFQKVLQQSEETYKSLFDNVNDAILVLKKRDRRIIDANKKAYSLYGYTYLELMNSTLGLLSLEVFDDYRQLDDIMSGKITSGQSRHKKKDGTEIYVEFNASVLSYRNEDVIIFVARDITERKISEEQLQKSVNEKEILLREVHHRVKNNMQLINSLLDLQIGTATDSESIRTIMESQNRIKVMSMVYERLFESDDLYTIDVEKFVRSIVSYLYEVYRGSEKNIHIDYFIDKFPLNIETAIPVSLIICELVTNSLKYAFPESSYANTIEIRYNYDHQNGLPGSNYKLIVLDNGKSFPYNLNPEKSSTLGLQLVYILAKQIKGKVSYDFQRGTKFQIEYNGV